MKVIFNNEQRFFMIQLNRLCLDNFDNVKENVMSIIANQIQVIREAMFTSQHTVLFSGLSMKLNSNFAVFVTLPSSYNSYGR